MLSVIIPVYNERRTIAEIIRRVCAVDIPKQIVIVDDCSTDGTRRLLETLEKDPSALVRKYPSNRFLFIYMPKNYGKGRAVREGIAKAEEPITLIQDADLEYDPSDYPRLIDPIVKGRADVVYGSRFTGNDRRVLYFWHSCANKLLTLVSNILTNLTLTDMETGYKAFRTPIIKGIPLRSNRFGFEPEVTAKIAKLGCRIYEVPIAYYGRTYAQGKKIRSKDAIEALYTIVKYWFVEDLYTAESAGVRTLHIMQSAGRYNTWLYRQVEPFLGNSILEMGSGVGNITGFLLDRDYVAASDVSDVHLLELRRAYEGFPNVKVIKLDFNDPAAISKTAETEDIDTVLSMNVLEHVEHDNEALIGCARILKTGGRLVLMVPAHKALFSRMDRQIGHFRRYDLPSLRAKVVNAGFTIVHERHFNMLGAIGWFVNGRLLGRKLLPSRQLRAFDFFVEFLALEKLVRPPFGLGIVLIAEKQVSAESPKATTTMKNPAT